MTHALVVAVKSISNATVNMPDTKDLNHYIEHSLLKPDATLSSIEKLCKEALQHNFIGVCVPPYFVQKVKALLKEDCKVITVIGFPMGYSSTFSKVTETKRALVEGADEIDMVINLAALNSNDWKTVAGDIESVVRTVHLQGKKAKVIIESGMLKDEDIVKACEICAKLDVDFVKTSTGFNGSGASVAHVKLMRENLPEKIKIKASGGIKTKAFALELINAGANRIGTSSGIQILEE